MVARISPSKMEVLWRPLTLSEARGFVNFYNFAYTPRPDSRRRQASQETMYVKAIANFSSLIIQGLSKGQAYSVTVAASTTAGIGPASVEVVVDPFPTTAAPSMSKQNK